MTRWEHETNDDVHVPYSISCNSSHFRVYLLDACSPCRKTSRWQGRRVCAHRQDASLSKGSCVSGSYGRFCGSTQSGPGRVMFMLCVRHTRVVRPNRKGRKERVARSHHWKMGKRKCVEGENGTDVCRRCLEVVKVLLSVEMAYASTVPVVTMHRLRNRN